MNPFVEWLRAHAPLLQQINKGVRRGLVPPGFDRLQDVAKQFGKDQGDALQKIGADVGPMPRVQDYKTREEYATALSGFMQRAQIAYANVALSVGTPESGRDQIASPALKLPSGKILTGKSHPHIFFENDLAGNSAGVKDGFLTMDGKFVGRKRATAIARKAGQLDTETASEIKELGNGELNSGDYSPPAEGPLSAAVGRARDRMAKQVLPSDPIEYALTTPLGEQKAAEVFHAAKSQPFPYQLREPHAPNQHLSNVARRYVTDNAIDTRELPRVSKVDPEKGKMMADAYDALKSDPHDPEVRAAYAQFGKEVQQQHDALIKAGYNFDYSPHDPYPNSAAMLKDLRDNKTIKVFKTAEGQEHPLLSNEQNDMFRAVHDALGHGINGNQFGPKGEEHAFRDHSAMFSPLARRVMATETRGQNSWVNFGPHSDAPMTQRPYAEQKAALWPEHLMGDYHEMTPPAAENWLQPHISVEEPSIIRKVEPIARPGAAPEQRDLPRVIGKNQRNIDDVEDLAYKTYMGPHFRRWLDAGRDIPNAPNWYDTRATQQKAVDALGDEEGPPAFRELMNFMGASTAMSRPSNNLRRASWWRALNMAGMLDPESLVKETLPAPPGMGHIAQRAHHHAVADLVQRGALDSFANPKPASFVENLTGNDRPYTNDTRMGTATLEAEPKMEMGIANNGAVAPRKWAYAPMERAFQRAAQEYHKQGLLYDVPEGHDPTATAQAQIWAGIGGWRPGQANGGNFNDIFNGLLSHSAKMWGVSPDVANRLLWQGNPFELPLNAPLLKR